MIGPARETVDLTGVPETMLLPLWNRAAFAGGPRAVIDDPMSIELVERIDYAFARKFGKPHVAHAIRARWSDALIARFLDRTPDATVVALGEGLETQLWRVDNGTVNWLSVDVPEAIDIRRRFLPKHERATVVACSALDETWLDRVPDGKPVFVSAAGLLMYFKPGEVEALLRAMTARFPGGEIFFDTIPRWFSTRTLKGYAVTEHYTFPPMPFSLPIGQAHILEAKIPGFRIVEALSYAEPYPRLMRFFALLSKIGWLKNRLAPGLVHGAFDPAAP